MKRKADAPQPGNPTPPRKVQKRKALTPQTRKLLELLAEDPTMTLEEAGRLAGYKASPRQHAHQALKSKSVNAIWREMMEKDPRLTHKALQDRLAEGLGAKKVHFFAHEGSVVSERETVDYGTRATYLGLAAKVVGAEAPLKTEVSGPEGDPIEFEGLPLSLVPLDKLVALIDRLTAEDRLPQVGA